MLDENNALVKVFRMARDRYTECNTANVRLRLINCCTNRSSQYNLPTAFEVAGLIVGDLDCNNGYHDIIVEDRDTWEALASKMPKNASTTCCRNHPISNSKLSSMLKNWNGTLEMR